MSVRFQIFPVAIFLALSVMGLGLASVPTSPFNSASTPQPSVTPTQTSAVTWQSQQLFSRWREYQEKIFQYAIHRALLAYMAAHPPEAIRIEHDSILIEPTFDFRVHAIHVSPKRAQEFPLVILSYLNGIGTTQRTLLFTWVNGRWQAQALPSVDLEQVQAAHYIPGQAPPELLVISDTCAFCSATGVRFEVWRWERIEWKLVWRMPFGEQAKPHGELELNDSTFQTIHLRYSSWNQWGTKNLFHESNPGPHRYFIETWVRERDIYKLIGTESEASAYNTLVEFTYAMNHHDWEAARRWVIDPSLVQTARDLGYENISGFAYPPERYYSGKNGVCSIWTIEQCDVWNIAFYKDGKTHNNFTVHLEQRGTQWFVNSIHHALTPTPKPTRVPNLTRTPLPAPHIAPTATPRLSNP